MTLLYDRKVQVSVRPGRPERTIQTGGVAGGERIDLVYDTEPILTTSDLRIRFNVSSDFNPEPNRGTIEIFNLSRMSRDSINKTDLLTLSAGYVGHIVGPLGPVLLPEIFKGNITFIDQIISKPDISTKIVSGDGEVAYNTARLDFQKVSNVSVVDLADKIEEVLQGVSIDLSGSSVSSMIDRITSTLFDDGTSQNGICVSKKMADVLSSMLDKMGIDWSFQKNTLKLKAKFQDTGEPPIELSASTGLIGSPSKREGGGIKFTSLLIPELTPGRKVEIVSDTVDGGFIMSRVDFTGDTHGPEWTAQVEAI